MDFRLLFVIIAGYLLGSANTSLLVGKLYGIDVRQHGSGNAGATNTLRTLGKGAAVFVGIGDVLKGILSCLIGFYTSDGTGLMVGGIAAIIGHNWPVYFGFKGGKGIFTSLAVVMMMNWRIGLILLGIFVIVVAVTKYISLGSIVASALFPVFAVVFKEPALFFLFSSVIGLLAIIRHYPNIKRIINGVESKLGAKKGG